MPGPLGGRWRDPEDHARVSAAGRLPGVRRGAGTDQHLACRGLRLEGVLRGCRQGAGRGDCCGCIRFLVRAARPSPRGAGGAARGRRGGCGGTDDRVAAVERAGPVCVCVRPGGHGRAPQPGAGQPGCAPAGRTAWQGRDATDPHAPARCLGCLRLPRPARCGRHCGPTASGPWWMRWCWAGCAACEVLGLRLEDLSAGERRLFVAEAKGGRQRIVPVSARFFAAAGAYLESERPAAAATSQVFVVLKGHGAASRCRRPGWMRPGGFT